MGPTSRRLKRIDACAWAYVKWPDPRPSEVPWQANALRRAPVIPRSFIVGGRHENVPIGEHEVLWGSHVAADQTGTFCGAVPARSESLRNQPPHSSSCSPSLPPVGGERNQSCWGNGCGIRDARQSFDWRDSTRHYRTYRIDLDRLSKFHVDLFGRRLRDRPPCP